MLRTPQSTLEFGQQNASLYLGFCCFIHDQASRLELDRIFFCTREGEFFKAVFDALFYQDEPTNREIKTHILEVSRLATFGPSLKSLDAGSLMRIWHQYTEQSPFSFLTTLKLCPQEMQGYFERAGLPLNAPVAAPWCNREFMAVLGDEGFLAAANDQLAENRKLAVNYLETQFAGSERIGMVDIGWRGSTQDNLALIFEQKIIYGFYLGISRYFNKQPENVRKSAFGPNRNMSAEIFDLLHAVDVMEMISNSPGGSVTGYRSDPKGKPHALRKQDPAEDAAFLVFTKEFQDGVISAAREADPLHLMNEYADGHLKRRALTAWREILNHPSDELVRTYFSLKHNEEFGTGEFHDKSRIPSVTDILICPFSSRRWRKIREYVRYSQWAKGVSRRTDLSPVQRLTLPLLIKLGLMVKAVKHRKPLGS
jgi:hypothetical protein